MEPAVHYVDNGEGWRLELKRYRPPAQARPARPPVVMIPGYAMNTFILAYHPQGPSMVEYLVADGFEVWTANLRGQGGSRRTGRRGRTRFGLRELSLVDLPRALDAVRKETRQDRLDVVGCSLGASIIYAWLAHHPTGHGIRRMVSIGGPLRLDGAHPMIRLLFASPKLAGAIPIVRTRALARRALPLARRVPALLSIYVNARENDLSAADRLVETVDDPVPYINRQIARWLRERDLVVGGLNVTEHLRGIDVPVLVIYANADGIVPPAAACSVAQAMDDVTLVEAGCDAHRFAHADLFINPRAVDRVFEPMRAWLAAPATPPPRSRWPRPR